MNADGSGYQILKQFGGAPDFGPTGALTLDGSTIYGTVVAAGTGGGATNGFVYAIDLNGSNYRTVYAFTGAESAFPQSGVVLGGNTLYGTTTYGAIFQVNTDGTGFDIIGQNPVTFGNSSGLTLIGSTLYGLTFGGGAGGAGTIYRVNTSGSDYTVMHNFAGGISDGAEPWWVDLVSDGAKLFGTTARGGPNNDGTVFSINLDGTDFQVLHSFGDSDGSGPLTGLTLVGSTLYGVTGGTLGIFRINTDGSGFESLYTAAAAGNQTPRLAEGNLIPGGPNLFYGTTNQGGTSGSGIVFMFTVPEPSTFALAAVGIIGLAVMGFRRRRV